MSEYCCFIAEPAPIDGDDALYWHERNYYHPVTREIVPWHKLPPGALVAHDYSDGRPGPDGRMWYVKTPDGYPWRVDAPSKQGGFWTRTGDAPNFTVTPSIHVTCDQFADKPGPDGEYAVIGTRTLYHGFLIGGVLRSTPDSPV